MYIYLQTNHPHFEMHPIHKTSTLITRNQSSYLQLVSFSSSPHSTQDNEKKKKNQLAHFKRFKRFTGILVYKVLHFVKDQGPWAP